MRLIEGPGFELDLLCHIWETQFVIVEIHVQE